MWFLYPDFGRLYNFWPTFFKWHFNKVIVLRVLKKLFVYSVGNWEKKTTLSLLRCSESWVIKSLKSGEVGFLRDGPRVCRRSGCSPVYVWLAVWSHFVFIWILFFYLFQSVLDLGASRDEDSYTRRSVWSHNVYFWLFITFKQTSLQLLQCRRRTLRWCFAATLQKCFMDYKTSEMLSAGREMTGFLHFYVNFSFNWTNTNSLTDPPCLFWTASLQPDTVRFYSFIWSASTGLSMEKCVSGCLRVCMLKLGYLHTGVHADKRCTKLISDGGPSYFSVTTDTVSWTEVLKCATIPRHCRDVWTVCCWLTDQSDQASLSVTTRPTKSLGELVPGTPVLTVISNNLVT